MKNTLPSSSTLRHAARRRALALCATLSALGAASTAEAQAVATPARTFVQGDLDGDGFSDLVVPGEQEVLVFFGGRGGVSERPVAMRHAFVFGGQGTRFADAVEDLDGDGDAELVLVDFAADPWALGASVTVHVYEGGARTLGAERWTGGWHAPHGILHDSLGTLRAAGDVDGDGRPDVVAAGFVLFGGARGAAQRAHAVQALTTPDEARRAVIPLGDTDGDGRAELWTAPIRHDTPPPYYSGFGLRGSAGERASLDASGAWRTAPMPLFARASGSTHLVDVRAADLDGDGVDELLGSWFVPPMAVNAHVAGSQGVSVARRAGAGRFVTTGDTWATQPRESVSGVEFLRCAPDTDGDRREEPVTQSGDGVHGTAPQRWRGPADAVSVALPAGVAATGFVCARDLTGDGRADLVLLTQGPRASEFRARTVAW